MQPGAFSTTPPVLTPPRAQVSYQDAALLAAGGALVGTVTVLGLTAWAAGWPVGATLKAWFSVAAWKASGGLLFPARSPDFYQALMFRFGLDALVPAAVAGAWLAWHGWQACSKKIDPQVHESGHRLAEYQAASDLTRDEIRREGPGLFLSPTLRAGAERVRRSMFFCGSIGGGKTQALLFTLDQMIKSDFKLLIIDTPKFDFSKKTRDAIVIGPWNDGWGWHISADIKTRADVIELVVSWVKVNEKDPMWGTAGGAGLTAIFVKLLVEKGDKWGWADLLPMLFLTAGEIGEVAGKYYPPAKLAYADPESKTTTSLLINLSAGLRDVYELAMAWRDTPKDKLFGFVDWWKDENHKQRSVVIQTHGRYKELSRVWSSSVLRLLIAATASDDFGESKTRKNAIVCDEFAQLPKIDGFASFIETGRSLGVNVCLCTQSPSQIVKTWGQEDMQSWMSMIGTRFWARTLGAFDQAFVQAEVGKREVWMPSESISTDQDGRWSTSRSMSLSERPVITGQQLEALGPRADGRGVDVLITGIDEPAIQKIPFTTWPDLRPAVIPNPNFNQLPAGDVTTDALQAGVTVSNLGDQPPEPDSVLVSNPIEAELIPFNETVSNLKEAQPEPLLDGINSIIPNFAGVVAGINSPKQPPEPHADDSPLDDAIEHAVTDRVVDAVEQLTGVDGLGLALEIIEAVEQVKPTQKQVSNPRKAATRAKIDAAVASLKARGEKVSQGAVAAEAGVGIATVKRIWQEIEQ